jgi:ABC-type phosphate transport system substrate-binding protein
MSEAKEVTATFDLIPSFVSLKVEKTGTGSGPVTSTPAGIDCHSTCEASFKAGSKVTLVGVANPGSKAVVWGGCDAIVGSNECEVTMSTSREVTAFFDGTTCAGGGIVGAGSSLQGIAHTKVWKTGFEGTICPSGPTVTYNSTSSGSGLGEWNHDLKKGSINTGLAFIGTDDAPTAAQIANIKSKAGGAQLAVIPVAQTAITVLANPPADCKVKAITNSNLAGVFEGRITSWDKVEGSEGAGCKSPITRVVREDGSGTTYQFKNYLFQNYKEPLACTEDLIEKGKKATWQELEPLSAPNLSWPESCPEKTLSNVVRSGGTGGGAEVKKVNEIAGSIGYVALPDAKAGIAGSTTILNLQSNGQKKFAQGVFAEPASGNTANCGAMAYQVPRLNGRRDVDWSGVFGGKPAIGSGNYPLCALTYDIAFHGYQAAGFTEGQELTVRDYLYNYIVQTAGQAAIASNYYSPLPTSAEPRFDILGAAQEAAASISY